MDTDFMRCTFLWDKQRSARSHNFKKMTQGRNMSDKGRGSGIILGQKF